MQLSLQWLWKELSNPIVKAKILSKVSNIFEWIVTPSEADTWIDEINSSGKFRFNDAFRKKKVRKYNCVPIIYVVVLK